ncbi:MAG: hypothetical protein KGJ57_17515 [Sphingomonadales bacterium]|nr:hypothetical protein [Sphingomonadales bacterium]MDE2171197.1 hypothetical protein [Sphingomonadales bacterium]
MVGMTISVPWNAAWSAEESYEIRPCRYASGCPALWSPHRPGVGKPIFARPHMVRQRRSIAEWRCTVCGEKTAPNDRWWFRLGDFRDGWFMTTEAPVHHACARHALKVCPHLRGREHDLEPMPGGFYILKSMIGGPVSERDFGLNFPPQGVVGHLKIAWPENRACWSNRHG